MIVDFLNRVGLKLQALGGDMINWLSIHGLNILLILLGAWVARRFGVKLFQNLFSHTLRPELYKTKTDRERRARTLGNMSSAFVRTTVYIITGFLIISEINPSYTTALFASAGLVTVAIGFGAQSFIKDVVSGMFIIIENQYRIGDEVELQSVSWASLASGIVEDVGLRTTILRDLDGDLHHVPNGAIGYATNKSFGFNRINENIVVALNTDIDRLEHVVNHVGSKMAADMDFKSQMLEPIHFDRVIGLEDDGIIVKVLGKTTPSEQRRIKSEFYHRLLKDFAKNDIFLAKQKQPEDDKK